MRRSISAWMRSQMAYPYGRMTIVPRTGPVSASVAFASTSWYQRGKSAACEVSTPDTRWRVVRHGVVPRAESVDPRVRLRLAGAHDRRRRVGVDAVGRADLDVGQAGG